LRSDQEERIKRKLNEVLERVGVLQDQMDQLIEEIIPVDPEEPMDDPDIFWIPDDDAA
jgi:hypothetical protein